MASIPASTSRLATITFSIPHSFQLPERSALWETIPRSEHPYQLAERVEANDHSFGFLHGSGRKVASGSDRHRPPNAPAGWYRGRSSSLEPSFILFDNTCADTLVDLFDRQIEPLFLPARQPMKLSQLPLGRARSRVNLPFGVFSQFDFVARLTPRCLQVFFAQRPPVPRRYRERCHSPLLL